MTPHGEDSWCCCGVGNPPKPRQHFILILFTVTIVQMPVTRSGNVYKLSCRRRSVIDGRLCTQNGCYDEVCNCQPCPVCTNRVPGWVLTLKAQMMGGIWIGPHCIGCDMQIFFHQTL